MNSTPTPEQDPGRTIPVEEIFLKQAGIGDTAEFKAAAIDLAVVGLTAGDLTRIAHAHQRGELVIPDEPEPGPDLSLIPSSREEARPVEVNGVIITCWRDQEGCLWMVYADGKTYRGIEGVAITSVREIRLLADDEVAVPKKALDRLRDTYAEECAPRHGHLNGYGWRERVGNFLAALGGGDQA